MGAFSNYPGGFSNGLNVRGIPILNTYSNKAFWVDSNTGSDGNRGTFEKPFATIDYAIGQCTASKGDIVFVKPFHTETVTASITFDVIGATVIGLRQGNQMPIVTPNGAINAVTMTAAGSSIQNIEFAIPGTDTQTSDINIAADNCSVIGTRHHGSTTSNNKVNVIVVNTGANDFLIQNCRIYNVTVEVPAAIKIAAAVSRGEICGNLVLDQIGYTNGAIYDAAIALDLYVHHNTFQNAKAGTVVMNWVANSVGVCAYNQVVGRHTTIASNVVTGTGMNFFENYVVEEAALNGIIIPVADAEG